MQTLPILGWVFVALAAIFIGLAAPGFFKGEMSPGQRAWLRMGVIFACVGVFLFFMQTFYR